LIFLGSLLVQKLLIAKRDLRLPKLIKQFSGIEGLIIDDLVSNKGNVAKFFDYDVHWKQMLPNVL